MSGKANLGELLREIDPILHKGEYVFVSVDSGHTIDISDVLGTFKEEEGTTLILRKEKADELDLEYGYIASWISLGVHSALEAVGLTATVSTTLAKNNISCNVVAAYYHDHIFIDKKDADKALTILKKLAIHKAVKK